MLTINLVLWQVWVGGGVWHQGELHGQGGAGQGDGHAAVGGPHHPDDRVQLETHVPVLTVNQLLGVLQRSDGLEGNKFLITSLSSSPKSQEFMDQEPGWSLPINILSLTEAYVFLCLSHIHMVNTVCFFQNVLHGNLIIKDSSESIHQTDRWSL